MRFVGLPCYAPLCASRRGKTPRHIPVAIIHTAIHASSQQVPTSPLPSPRTNKYPHQRDKALAIYIVRASEGSLGVINSKSHDALTLGIALTAPLRAASVVGTKITVREKEKRRLLSSTNFTPVCPNSPSWLKGKPDATPSQSKPCSPVLSPSGASLRRRRPSTPSTPRGPRHPPLPWTSLSPPTPRCYPHESSSRRRPAF